MRHTHPRMARDSKPVSWWQVLLILALPLAVLFHPSFQSELVLFSNDGPLGVISSQAASLPGTFFGYWDDLHWVGQEKPSSAPNFSQLLGSIVNDAVVYSKISAPLSLLLLGFAGWLLFRQLRFRSSVCVLGAIAFALNMNFFSNACWGLTTWTVTMASALLALAALHLQPARMPFLKYVLAGFAVGHGITEGFDTGALYSLAIGAYAAFLVFLEKGDVGQKGLKAAGLVLAVAVSAAVFSTQILATLVKTQIQGVAGMGQTKEEKEKRWDAATQWSLPVKEVLRVGVPGLFGYRMTDLEGRPSASSYWGAVGRTPGWETHRQGIARHSGSGEYAGALVLAMAAFAVFQSLRGRRTPLDRRQRLSIWFWAGIALVSILLAFGRHAPFYHLPYELLPYFSTMRNPIKFMHLFHLAATILFGYGLQALWTHYLNRPPAKEKKLGKLLKQWWAKAPGFDRKWTLAVAGIIVFGLLSCLIYASAGKEVAQLLLDGGFSKELAEEIHTFSVFELLWSVAFFSIVWILVTLTLSGAFHWKHRQALGIALGLLLVADLGRADRFWIVYYDYKKKYTSNPVIDKLQENAFEGRVALRLNPFAGGTLSDTSPKGRIFHNMVGSWLQHQFPYYNISSLDVIQMPRRKKEDESFIKQFTPQPRMPELNKYTRLWELTSTRYLVGMTNYLAELNQQLDPDRERFQILSRFDFDVSNATKLEDIAVVEHSSGPFGIIEFTGALPKAKRYTDWIVRTNQQAALNKLAEPQFDPSKTVVVMDPTVKPPAKALEENDGTATIESYHPKVIRIQTAGSGNSVLLYNDRYHPHWKAYVNGKRRPLLRCNSIMRGVEVPAGSHVVEFRYEPPQWGLVISLSSIALGVWIGCLCLIGSKRKPPAAPDGLGT